MDGKISKRRRYQSNKSMKHLLERQRRARINHSLSELKSLVLSAIHQGNPQADLNGCEKMEKAEILELTVNYIKSINRRGNIGNWKTDCASRNNPGYNCFNHSARKDKSAEILCRNSSSQNYRAPRPTSSSTAVPCSYQSAHGKMYCACVSSIHYELVTPPLSPKMSGTCVNSQYGALAQAETLRQWKNPPTSGITSTATSTLDKVWRPW